MDILTRITRPRQRLIYTLSFPLMLCTTSAWGQDNPLNFSRTQTTLANIIEVIEQQTAYLFVYNASILDVSQLVTLPAYRITLSEALRFIEPQIGYRIFTKLNYIVVYTAEPYGIPAKKEPAPARTADNYLPSDPARVGTASNPRPGTSEGRISEKQKPAPQQPEPAYSKITPLDLYSGMENRLPVVSVKTNLLYTAVSYTPNVAVEVSLGNRHTLEMAFSHNRWKQKATLSNNEKLLHWIIRPEYRYWFCERYNGHFIGAHVFYAAYNISGKKVPLLFSREYRYEGHAAGLGITYGYHWAFAKKWGLEFNIGVGAAYMYHDRFGCKLCDRNADAKTKVYFGPTRAGISLVFMIK